MALRGQKVQSFLDRKYVQDETTGKGLTEYVRQPPSFDRCLSTPRRLSNSLLEVPQFLVLVFHLNLASAIRAHTFLCLDLLNVVVATVARTGSAIINPHRPASASDAMHFGIRKVSAVMCAVKAEGYHEICIRYLSYFLLLSSSEECDVAATAGAADDEDEGRNEEEVGRHLSEEAPGMDVAGHGPSLRCADESPVSSLPILNSPYPSRHQL
ncbi:hypothetical protein GALMADRAFT_133878 [Galerina marginata CBS 339.88]|uniref:Uncharacterized protein n=1 Tax=Galerina marginata (strain CBS 339.88) TaxID=685588 RepID=A0A067TZX6_GALM3|nr:hypothetical protein GALMADRAFT_133878 [Galerina marginata CBS 339.88]